jgi:hypothetical protein
MLERYSEGKGQFRKSSVHAMKDAPSLPREYANCKNRPWLFRKAPTISCKGKRHYGSKSMKDNPSQPEPAAAGRRQLSPAAQRALAEAEARRQAAAANAKPLPREYQGPKGLEPTRYRDWERNGIASDF